MRELRTTEEIELRIRTKSGGVCWELMRCRLYYYRDAVPYYILASWNIDKRKNLEEELRLMEEQYSMLEEVTDEFPLGVRRAQRRSGSAQISRERAAGNGRAQIYGL